MQLSSTAVVLVLLALAVPIIGYITYPPAPSVSEIVREVTGKEPSLRPMSKLAESIGRAACYMGYGSALGEPLRAPLKNLIMISKKPVMPAPGRWAVEFPMGIQVVTHVEAAKIIEGASRVRAEGFKMLIEVPSGGRIEVLIATDAEASMNGAIVKLHWLGHGGCKWMRSDKHQSMMHHERHSEMMRGPGHGSCS